MESGRKALGMTNFKEANELTGLRVPEGSLFAVGVLLAALAVFVAACASTQQSANISRVPSGVQEYMAITRESAGGVGKAIQSLEEIAQPNRTPSQVNLFSDGVQRLEIESIRIRARVQAIQARGDAYFEAWSENIAQLKDPQVRAAAEHFHPQLEQAFQQIKATSKEAGDAFRPFLAGLRRIRTELEISPARLDTPSANELILNTRKEGEQVLVKLAAISNELQNVTTMLTYKVR